MLEKKNVLIVGLDESLWHRVFLENIEKYNNDSFNLIFFGDYSDNLRDFCEVHNIAYYYPDSYPNWFNRIPKFRSLIAQLAYRKKMISALRTYKHFDTIHLYFVYLRRLLLINEISDFAGKIICTFCGSDLYRASKLEQKFMPYFLKKTSIITFMTQDMKNYFNQHIGASNNQKLKVLDFGSEMLDYIDRTSDVETCKRNLGLRKEDVVISIGYNGMKQQQHCKVIESISTLPDNIKNKIVIILQMTYSSTPEYLKEIREKIKAANIKSVEYTDFLPPEKLAEIRVATDIFIHAQITDAQSASVIEYLYAKKIVINPSWIKYSSLKEAGVFYVEYSDFKELSTYIKKYFEKVSDTELNEKLSNNQRIIRKMCSWTTLAPKWIELYK